MSNEKAIIGVAETFLVIDGNMFVILADGQAHGVQSPMDARTYFVKNWDVSPQCLVTRVGPPKRRLHPNGKVHVEEKYDAMIVVSRPANKA